MAPMRALRWGSRSSSSTNSNARRRIVIVTCPSHPPARHYSSRARENPLRRWWMPLAPVRRDVDPPRDPHLGMACKPIQHLGQPEGAAWMGDDAVVQSEAQHPRRILVDHALDGIPDVVEVVAACGDALAAETHVVVHKRIGNDQLVASTHLN